ncbi:ABC transporter permease [Candidatus Micrarchaeota archaeon]|nr:ABC transporter permease [Candidatus Micrarchaeota archaeon]
MKILSSIKKEILELSHDRTVLLVLFVFPVFVMVFMGSSFRSMEINGLPIGIAGATNTTFASMLFSGLGESQAFKLRAFDTEAAAMEEFRNGRLRAVISVPDDFDQSLLSGGGAQITVRVDNSDLALEQAVIAAMSSVIEASSTNITQAYISTAWEELYALNQSAASLAADIEATRAEMEDTKESLAAIKQDMAGTDIGSLEASMAQAAAESVRLQGALGTQKSALANASERNLALLVESSNFVQNASIALDESIVAVGNAHGNLTEQENELENTIDELDASILALQTIRDTTTDNTVKVALGLNIAALTSLRGRAESQLNATGQQIAELETLNATLQSFSQQLSEYSVRIDEAQTMANDSAAMEAALDEASESLHDLNASFSGAQAQIVNLKGLMTSVSATMSDIEGTLDGALEQTASVDRLIASLQQTVAEQTGKDPGIIASPLSVKVENQYERISYVDFIMPQIIAISLLFSCFLLGSISLVREKQRKTIMRALMVPGGMVNLVIGKVVTLVLLSFGQIAVILLVALVLFGVRPPGDIAMLLAGAAVSSLVLSSIGVLVGFFAKSESMAIQSCLILAIPMLFLGNIIFSPDLLPAYTQILQQLLPLAHVTSIFKVVLITNGDPTVDMMALLSYFVLLAALMTYLVMKRNDISSYL